jgi:hypothetical protein
MSSSLNGDSIYPNNPDDFDSVGEEFDAVEDSQEETGIEDLNLIVLESQPDSTVESQLEIQVGDGVLSVEQTSIALSCDMSQYESIVSIDPDQVSITFMPPNEERDCMYDVTFLFYHSLNEGIYTLLVMEDEEVFEVE